MTISRNKTYLILDVETTILNKGNPFNPNNQLCYIGYKTYGKSNYTTLKLPFVLSDIQAVVDAHDYLVAFNAKFDCHWLERIGVVLDGIRIWDCQYASFLFSNQQTKYPSLNGECEQIGLGSKIDTIKEKYWKNGVDTLDIPYEEMVQYLEQDVNLTEQLFEYQRKNFPHSKMRLFQLHMEDQVCLREMERNGILYNQEESLKKAEDVQKQIDGLTTTLLQGYEQCPINFDSTDHLSAYLYGGTIVVESRLPIGVYKSGQKVGLTRYKIVEHEYKLPRLVEPLPNSELKKDGLWATDEKTLRQLKGSKEFKNRLRMLNERSKLEKLRGTYYKGFPNKIAEMAWTDNTIHSSLNQCTVVTGRLSSTQPNQQNIPPECKQLCISRYN